MDGREQRDLEIAATKKLRQNGLVWIVPSQRGTGTYVVDPAEPKPTCSCPDYEDRGEPCKHIFAVEFTIRRETTQPDGSTVTETVRMSYTQQWSPYNLAQVNETDGVARLLHELCSAIDNPVQTTGRPRLPLADVTFACVMKVYGGASGRRSMTTLQEYAARGYIDKAPCYNSIFRALETPTSRRSCARLSRKARSRSAPSRPTSR